MGEALLSQIATLAEIASKVESAPLEVLQESADDLVAAYEALGHAYNRWLMDDWKGTFV